jgi:electron transfer flavoprotein beta subunit
MGIRKIEKASGKKVDLVICGKQTNDGDTGHVGPGIAAWLEVPNVAYVKKVDEIKEGMIRVFRMMEDGTDVIEMPLPAVIAVVKEINEPRVPSLKGKMAAKKAVVARWTASDIEAEKTKIGLGGSPTIVASSFNPPPRQGGIRIEGATPEEKAKKLVAKLLEMKLL